MNRIEIAPSDCPSDKFQKQKTLVLAVEKLLEEYLASEDDRISVWLSVIGTVMSNLPPSLREDLYKQVWQHLRLAMQVVERNEKRGGA